MPSMPLFVKPADVILRMQLSSDLAGIDDVVTSGIVGAQLHVQRIIDGRLERQAQDARYFVDSESFSGIAPNGGYRLELPSGFIRTDVPILIHASVPKAGAFDEKSAVDQSLVFIDYNRGYIRLDPNVYADCHVRVRCETGFGVDEAIPAEIYEAIMSLVPMVFNMNQSTNRSNDAKQQYQAATDHAEMLLQSFTRLKGFTFRAA
jgi:hypothetical protein